MNFCSDCKHKYTMSQSPCTECSRFNKKESGNPAVALLEKIRAEILSEYPQAESDKARLTGYGIHIALEIIDKHISELKGSE